MLQPANVGVRLDPVLGYNFLVSFIETASSIATALPANLQAIAETAVGGFNECSGLEMSLEIEEYKQGGQNGYVHRFPTRVNWSNIILKKGIRRTTDLWDWQYAFTQGKVRRRDGLIVLLNEQRVPHTIWVFRRGLPVKYTAPTLNAEQNQVAIETLEIAHEGIVQLTSLGGALSAATS